MPQEIILRLRDTIDYGNGKKGQIEKIRIISNGQPLEQYKYDGKGDDIVLTLKDNSSSTNLWLKDASVHKIIEKEKKG
ncbi:MAG: hypothetical protein NTX47_03035 [Candidatus Omnitrophica bacterium]|nr:hypothetical protein [Candidatus Omnitrophota bacterium]